MATGAGHGVLLIHAVERVKSYPEMPARSAAAAEPDIDFRHSSRRVNPTA